MGRGRVAIRDGLTNKQRFRLKLTALAEKQRAAGIQLGKNQVIFTTCRECGSKLKSVISGECVNCRKQKAAELRRSNGDFVRAKQKLFYHTHKERICAENRFKYENDHEHREKRIRYSNGYRKKHIKKVLAAQRLYRENNRQKLSAASVLYQQNNPARLLAREHRRRARKLKAAPKDQTLKEMNAITAMIQNRPEGYEVDHIIPLYPCRDCGERGSHSLANLQYLTISQNRSKGRRCMFCWKKYLKAGRSL